MRRGAPRGSVAVATLVIATLLSLDAARADNDAFARGVELMREGKFAEACPFVRQGHVDNPTDGKLFTLAECLRLSGERAAALRHYRRFLVEVPSDASKLRQSQRRDAEEQVKQLKESLPSAFLRTSSSVARAEVRIDGRVIPSGELDAHVYLEEGDHELFVDAGRKKRWRMRFFLAEGERKYFDIEAEIARAESPSPDEPKPQVAGGGWGAWELTAVISGPTSLVLLAVGGVAVGITASAQSTADEECRPAAAPGAATPCSQAGVDAIDRGETSRAIAIGTLVSGGALSALAITALVALEHDAIETSRIRLRVGPSGLSVVGRF